VFRNKWFLGSFMGLVLCLSHPSNAQDDSFLDLICVHGEERSEILAQILEKNFFAEGKKLVETETWRVDAPSAATEQNQTVTKNLKALQTYLQARAEDFNRSQKNVKLAHFVWPPEKQWPADENEAPPYWLFGFRIGSGEKVISIINHLDTVPPGEATGWEPFNPKIEEREYLGKDTPFWVGRGTIDDKGPAVAAFSVLRAIAKTYDHDQAKLEGVTLEVIFDSSEETDMSTPHYLQDETVKQPDFGIVFDAMWIIRAEKGIERPVFTVDMGKMPTQGLWIEKLNTPAQSSVNQIPDNATATIRAETEEAAQAFADTVAKKYQDYAFDDPSYCRAELTVALTEDKLGVELTTKVDGAQHGSAPQENREHGANPLVSLINFLAHLADKQELRQNGYTRLSQFTAWMWGTHVFGEAHPSLYAYDWLFKKGNGTTYAVTTIGLEESLQQTKVKLAIDIRYALKHHREPLDDTKEGTLPGPSTFAKILPDLVKQFNTQVPGPEISVVTTTPIGPEFRRTDNPNLVALRQAYKKTMGESAPLIATGGGTDSKGFPKLLAAGALFANTLGPPINFHGIGEGAPLPDIYNSARIFYQLFVDIINDQGRDNK
jgi:succinyl-diaminopimelate desuccinylase